MRSLNIKDYALKDFQKVTSKWISGVFNNFVDNFLYLFDGFKKLNEKHEIYRVVSDKTMDFLYTEAATNPQDPLIITGFQTPLEQTNVEIKQAFKTVSLAESNVESLIPLVDSTVSTEVATIANDDDGSRALSSAAIYRYDPAAVGQLTEDLDLRRIIDDTGYIWYTEMTDGVEQIDASTLGLVLSLPLDTLNEISYIEIYPYGGTSVESVTFNGEAADDETIDVASLPELHKPGYPVRIHINKQNFVHEINIILGGYNTGGSTYFYSLGYIRAYVADFASSGRVAYDIGTPGILSAIELIKPYIYPLALHDKFPIDIKIVDNVVYDTVNEDDGRVYDTGDSNFEPNDYPLDEDLDLRASALPGIATSWIIIFTLNNTNEVSPVFRKCNLTLAP